MIVYFSNKNQENPKTLMIMIKMKTQFLQTVIVILMILVLILNQKNLIKISWKIQKNKMKKNMIFSKTIIKRN